MRQGQGGDTVVEGARSARVGDPQRELPAVLNPVGLISYYAATAASESASETGFRFHREEEGSRFVFYAGPDPLFGSGGNGRREWRPLLPPDGPEHPGPLGYSDPGQLDRLLQRTARLAGEKVFYGYPLVVTADREFLPVLFAAWPVSGGEVQINPALLPADPGRRRFIWRKLAVLRRVLAEGSEPDPRKARAFRGALASLIEALGLRPGESLVPGDCRGFGPPAAAGGEAGAVVQAGAEAESEAEAEAAAGAEAEVEAAAKAKAGARPRAEAVADAETEVGAKAAAQADAGAEAEPEIGAKAEAEAEPKADAEAEAGSEAVDAGSGAAAPAVYNYSILFRGSSPRLPLWLWEDWQYLLEKPAALGEMWVGNEGDDKNRGRAGEDPAGSQDEAADETRDEARDQRGNAPFRQAAGMLAGSLAGTQAGTLAGTLAGMQAGPLAAGCPLLLSPFSPAERERLGLALRAATRRRGWDYLDVPAGDHLQEYLFHLVLNGWYAGLRVLVLVPGIAEARQIHDRFASITALPMVAIWGGAAERRRAFADLQWLLRRRRHQALPPDETLVRAGEAQLESAWLELRQREEMVAHAAEAGESLAPLGKELEEAAAGLPSSLLAVAERELPGSAAGGFGALGKEVEALLLEAERVAAGRWHWSERLWPWQRRRRALARLELKVRSLLHRAGLNSGDWFAAPLPGDAEGMLKSLRLLRAAFNYADLLGRYQQVKLEAGVGAWDAPEGFPGRLAKGWEALAAAAGAAARVRRDWELVSLPESVVDQLELLLLLHAELAAAAPGSPAEQELERAVDDNFAAAVETLPVWIVPLAEAAELLPQRPALFDLLVVGGAERIPLAAVLPFAMRAGSVILLGDARSEAEAVGERVYENGLPGSKSKKQELAAAYGLKGLDYVLYGWPAASLRWLRQTRAASPASGSTAAGSDRYLRHQAFPIGQLLNRLYFGGSLLPAGPPANGFAARTGISTLRWVVIRGEMGSPESGSAYNLDEAEAVAGLLGDWLAALRRQAAESRAAHSQIMESANLTAGREPEGQKPVTIAVVTPFARQRELLLQQLAALLPDGYEELAEISVLRVDELAGRRFDVVLASTVLSGEYPAAHHAYLAQHPEFVYALLSAARMSLTVVGDPTAISTLGGVWSDLVDGLGRQLGGQPSRQKAEEAAVGGALAARGGTPTAGVGTGSVVATATLVAPACADQGQLASPKEDPSIPRSFAVKGPYPPGSRGVSLAYQELILMQNGWQGRRFIG